MGDIEDISAENRDLQEAILQKDVIIEDLERQIGNMVQEGEIKMKQTLEKMRMEYEIMARSAVSTKLRKMNEYLHDKFKRQEDLDNERDNVAKGIQIDLEERLTNSVNDVHQCKDKLRSKYFIHKKRIIFHCNFQELNKSLKLSDSILILKRSS